jgi:hypothetical protein
MIICFFKLKACHLINVRLFFSADILNGKEIYIPASFIKYSGTSYYTVGVFLGLEK